MTVSNSGVDWFRKVTSVIALMSLSLKQVSILILTAPSTGTIQHVSQYSKHTIMILHISSVYFSARGQESGIFPVSHAQYPFPLNHSEQSSLI